VDTSATLESVKGREAMGTSTFTITTPSDREIAMSRVFDAPRRLVFDAWTKPELLRRWLGVREGWTMVVCEVDLRLDGRYRYVWRGPKEEKLGLGGTFREIAAPERLISTEAFEEEWYTGEAIDTLVLIEKDGKTTATLTMLLDSKAARDMALQSGMEIGVAQSYDVLDTVLTSLGQRAK
jgi:uncharacterized protein YndB with AHSA1/START domain